MTEMVEMIDPVLGEIIDERQIAEQLLAQAEDQGVSLIGPGGLLGGLTKTVLETALEAEMTEHLGYEKHEVTDNANARNGTRSKTVLTEVGAVEIEVPRDRDGSYDVGIRRIICSTNAIESLNARYRRAVRARGHFPNDAAALKCLYLATRSLDPTGRGWARWVSRSKPRSTPLRSPSKAESTEMRQARSTANLTHPRRATPASGDSAYSRDPTRYVRWSRIRLSCRVRLSLTRPEGGGQAQGVSRLIWSGWKPDQ